MREGAVEVTVSGLKSTDTDLYRCEIEVFYPPPYLRLTGNGTLIHVLGETPPQDTQTLTCTITHLAHSTGSFLSVIESRFHFFSFVHRQL